VGREGEEAAQKTGHCISVVKRFITHLQGVQIRYKIGKIIKYRQEKKALYLYI